MSHHAPRAAAAACALLLVPATAAAAPPPSTTESIARAGAAIWKAPQLSHAAPGDAFQAGTVIVDPDGGAHVRYGRTHDGLPVRGGDLIVHLSPSGALEEITSAQTARITLATTPVRTAASAKAVAEQRVGGGAAAAEAELVVDATTATPRLAYDVAVADAPGEAPGTEVLTDAKTGQVISERDQQLDAVGTAKTQWSGTQTINTTAITGGFSLKDPVRNNSTVCITAGDPDDCPLATDADNTWGNGSPTFSQTLAADVAYGMSSTVDMLEAWFGRASIRTNGTPVVARVNTFKMQNAFYDLYDESVNFFAGDGARPFTRLDIVGHELGHALVEQLVRATTGSQGLGLGGESGGLHESYGDVFGTLTEFYGGGAADPFDYKIGEGVKADGTPLRYMYKPSLDGKSPDCWSTTLPADIHYKAGIPNKAFYMLAEGSAAGTYGASPTCGAAAVPRIGPYSAGRIWYGALAKYVVSNTAFRAAGNNDMRAATLRSATDLFGLCSKEYQAVQAAWSATSVDGEDANCHGTFSNGTVTTVPGNSTVTSPVNVPINGTLPTGLQIAVNVNHARRGDVVLELIAPNGTVRTLKAANPSDGAAFPPTTYTVPGPTTPNGTWKLRVRTTTGTAGTLRGWSVTV